MINERSTTVKFVDVKVGAEVFRARLLHEEAPAASDALWRSLPYVGRLMIDEWSGSVGRVRSNGSLRGPRARKGDRVVAFPYKGLVMLDPARGELAVCYGQGRLQDGLGPIGAIPLCAIGGDLTRLARIGERLQYDGSVPFLIESSSDQVSPLADAPLESGVRLSLQLGGAVAIASLLERTSPVTTASLLRLLPFDGIATNTFVSGPLLRPRLRAMPDAEWPLDTGEDAVRHVVLWPGYVYYRVVEPRGLRIAVREATTMGGGIIGGGVTRLVPVARLVGDWSAFRRIAERLVEEGAKSFRISTDIAPGVG